MRLSSWILASTFFSAFLLTWSSRLIACTSPPGVSASFSTDASSLSRPANLFPSRIPSGCRHRVTTGSVSKAWAGADLQSLARCPGFPQLKQGLSVLSIGGFLHSEAACPFLPQLTHDMSSFFLVGGPPLPPPPLPPPLPPPGFLFCQRLYKASTSSGGVPAGTLSNEKVSTSLGYSEASW